MSKEPSQPSRPGAPLKVTGSIQVRLPFATGAELRERLGGELSRGVLFVRTRTPKPVGALLRFDFRFSSGDSALRGLGRITESATEETAPARPGMLLQFVALERETHELLKGLGLPQSLPVVKPPPVPSSARAPLGTVPPPARPSAPEPTKPAAPAPPRVTLPGPPPPPQPDPVLPRATVDDDPLDLIGPSTRPEFPAPPRREETPTAPPQVTRDQAPDAGPDPETLFPDAAQRAAIPRKGPIVGIDLGTSNSCVAWMHHGRLQVIPSREGWNTVPSMVALSSRGKLLVGHAAKGQLLINPHQTVFGAKRLVGRPFHSQAVTELRERFPYSIVEGPEGEAAVALGGRTYTLQEISALVLKDVREVARGKLGRDITRAVITVPAFYNERQRQAVRDAGGLAGIYVEQIVSEPTAAALAYGHGKRLEKRVLVYDLGGGTFDVSVLELKGNVYEVTSTGGDTFLGGVDFDLRLLELMLAKFEQAHGVPFEGESVALQRMLDAAERAKMALSESTTEHVLVPFVAMNGDKPLNLDCHVTRDELEAATVHLVERTLQVTGEVLAARGLKPTDIAEVLLIGGQSRTPLVRAKLREYFGKEATRSVHPDEAVALGAAALAHSLEAEDADSLVLVDVLPMSLGIGLPGGRFKKIIERNARLPHTVTHTVSTTRDDQSELELVVFQGENERAVDNDYLGSVYIRGLPKAPRGAVKLDITFRLTREAILVVTTREESTGLEVQRELATRDTPEQLRVKLADTAKPSEKKGLFGFFRKLFGKAA